MGDMADWVNDDAPWDGTPRPEDFICITCGKQFDPTSFSDEQCHVCRKPKENKK